jgi:hypothetical protein
MGVIDRNFTNDRKLMKNWSKRKIFKTIWFSAVIVFFAWNWSTFQSRNLPKDTFESTEKISVIKSDNLITFQVVASNDNPNVIFFQGGLTDPKAYAPLCRKLAENGFTCHLIKMDWRMPQYDYKKTLKLFKLGSGNYVIGGHSQGGKMAAQIVYENPTLFKGLFLLGTSHPRDIDLSSLSIPTMKIYAEKDGLASVHEILENKNKLPKNSKLILLKGGNHSQFGYLGKLLMDNSADISLEEQQRQTVLYILEFLNDNKKGK